MLVGDQDRVALVTGANKGIGLEIARKLGQLGLTVLVGARSRERGERAAAALRAEGLMAIALPLDVTDEDSVQRAAQRIAAEFGRLDVLVNNAGVAYDLDSDGAPRVVNLSSRRGSIAEAVGRTSPQPEPLRDRGRPLTAPGSPSPWP